MVDSPLLKFSGVYKKLGGKTVLNEVDLEVARGQVVGIVGSNGSGKTTLLRLVAGLLYPDQGSVIVSDKEVRPGLLGELPVSVGALFDQPSFLLQFSGYQNLSMLAGIRQKIGSNEIQSILQRVGLDPKNRKPVRTYSLGMMQRLGIAQAVMEEPDLLLFDEPTNGLDSDGVKMFSEILEELVKRKASVLMVSHVQEEINRFCDRVFRIQEGRLTPLRQRKARRWRITVKSLEDLEKLSRLVPSLQLGDRVKGYPTAICQGEWKDGHELRGVLSDQGVHWIDIREQSIA